MGTGELVFISIVIFTSFTVTSGYTAGLSFVNEV